MEAKVSPAGRTAILIKSPALTDVLQTVIVETIVDVDDGTVYRVVSVFAAGLFCPNTLYAVGIFYPPICKNDIVVGSGASCHDAIVPLLFRNLSVCPTGDGRTVVQLPPI